MTTVIGIDPGLTGAAAAITAAGAVSIIDLPTKAMEYAAIGDRRIDLRELVRSLRSICPAGDGVKVVLEEVGIMGQGNAIQSVGSLCASAALILGALDILGTPPHTVQPRRWKEHFGLKRGADEKTAAWKKRHRDMALRLYPAAPITLAKHDGRAEALLIAHWGRSLL